MHESDIRREKPTMPRGDPREYRAPRLTRVRIETSRMKLGYEDADQFCTIHIHQQISGSCGF